MSSSTALVTGATGGIGVHITRQFADQGLTVLVGARDAVRGAEVAAQFGGRPLLLDVTDADSIATAAATASELDVLVTNAGISLDRKTSTSVSVTRAPVSCSCPRIGPARARGTRQGGPTTHLTHTTNQSISSWGDSWPPAGRNDGHQWGNSWPPVGRTR